MSVIVTAYLGFLAATVIYAAVRLIRKPPYDTFADQFSAGENR